MNPYKNQIIGIGAAALLAIAPAIATGIDNRTRGVAQRLDADTMTISAKELLDATPLADRLFLDAVCSQLRGDDSTALRLLDSSIYPHLNDSPSQQEQRAERAPEQGDDRG